MKQIRHESADSFPLRPREKHGVVKAINKRCSKDLQAVVDGYCKFWVKGNRGIVDAVVMCCVESEKRFFLEVLIWCDAVFT